MFALAKGRQGRLSVQPLLAWCRGCFTAKSESDFEYCDKAEVEHMARDLRMSASELRAVASKGAKAADLLLHRMSDLDMDPKEVARLEPAALRDLQRVCTLCNAHRRCARDFAHDAPQSTWEHYCPNAGTLAALNGLPWPSRREW